jgi:hypothetical protein
MLTAKGDGRLLFSPLVPNIALSPLFLIVPPMEQGVSIASGRNDGSTGEGMPWVILMRPQQGMESASKQSTFTVQAFLHRLYSLRLEFVSCYCVSGI